MIIIFEPVFVKLKSKSQSCEYDKNGNRTTINIVKNRAREEEYIIHHRVSTNL
tara:strand:- start:2 stop:160 length:159 start_codon:yes stop_codon:yes gene_type:complete